MSKPLNIALIIDMQYDFFADDGTLKVNGGKQAVENAIERLKNTNYDAVFFTADFHPFKHCSFKENGGTWPQHCVAHTKGAAIPIDLMCAAYSNPNTTCVKVLKKGNNKNKEEYSFMQNVDSLCIFFSELNGKFLDEMTPQYNIDIMGIAGDVCVLQTIKDLVTYRNKDNITVVTDCIASLDGGIALTEYCTQNNIKMV